MCLCKRKEELQRHSLFNFISFWPDPLIGICMTPRARAARRTDDYRCPERKQYICCCSPSLFCRQGAEYPGKLKSPNTTTQTLRNVLCCICASRSSHSPDWRGLTSLCYRCHATWLLFISCFPVLRSARAPLLLLSKKENTPPCTWR